jgi:hypothetical protein
LRGPIPRGVRPDVREYDALSDPLEAKPPMPLRLGAVHLSLAHLPLQDRGRRKRKKAGEAAEAVMNRMRDCRGVSLHEGMTIMEGFGWSILVCHAVILLGEPSERRNIRVSFFGGCGGEWEGSSGLRKGKGYGAVMRCSGSSFGSFFLLPSIFFASVYIDSLCDTIPQA